MEIFEMPKSRVYILTNASGEIIRIEGEYSLPDDLTGWVKIDEGEGDKYNLAQTHYLDKLIKDQYTGKYNYKYINGQIVEV